MSRERWGRWLLVMAVGLNALHCPAVTSGPEVGCTGREDPALIGRPFPDLPADASVGVLSVELGGGVAQPRAEAYSSFAPATSLDYLGDCPYPEDAGGHLVLDRSGRPIDIGAVELRLGDTCDGGTQDLVATLRFVDGSYLSEPTTTQWPFGRRACYTLLAPIGQDGAATAIPLELTRIDGSPGPGSIEVAAAPSISDGGLRLEWAPFSAAFLWVTLRGPSGARRCRALDFARTECTDGRACIQIPGNVLSLVGSGTVEVEMLWMNASSPGPDPISQLRRAELIDNLVGLATHTIRFNVEIGP